MKKQFFVYILLLFLSPVFAQPGFNKIYDWGLPGNDFRDMIVVNDTLICYSSAVSNLPPYTQGILLAKFDSSGNEILHKMILDPNGKKLSVSDGQGNILKTSDGGYLMTSATIEGANGVVVKTDKDFNVEFYREYDTLNYLTFFYRRIFELPEGYLTFGETQYPNYKTTGFVHKIDKQGNTIWFKTYPTVLPFWAYLDCKPLNDSTFVLIGSSSPILAPKKEADWLANRPRISLLNSNTGNLIRDWQSENSSRPDLLWRIVSVDSSGYTVFGHEFTGFWAWPFPDEPLFRDFIMKLDTNFQVVWRKYVWILGSRYELFYDIEKTVDNNYIGVGYRAKAPDEINSTKWTGWFHKFTPDGDSLWSLRVFPDLPLDETDERQLCAAGILSSGNIVSAGYTHTKTGTWYGWLVKITNEGCVDTLYCAPTTPVIQPEIKNEVLIYPNPADDVVLIEMNGNQKNLQMEILDLSGKVILSKHIVAGQKTYETSVKNIPAGLYFIRIRGEGMPSFSEKLIINH